MRIKTQPSKNYNDWFEIELFIYINMYLALNNLQKLICHKTQTNNIKYFEIHCIFECYPTFHLLIRIFHSLERSSSLLLH